MGSEYLIHEYFGVDDDVLWKTTQEGSFSLRIKIKKLLAVMNSNI
jgi:uncharacterized protein with HEPN domain